MNCNLILDSDSTYCSLYEGSQEKNRRAKYKATHKKNYSKVLDEIHKKILMHWEGRKLIGKIQAQQYMKEISKMNISRYKDQYFAEKIQSSLLKIFHLAKEFERSFTISQLSGASDPIKDCSLTQDLKFKPNITIDPKQILLGTTSVNTEEGFPLDILTNNNFVSFTSQLNNIENISQEVNEHSDKMGTKQGEERKLCNIGTKTESNVNSLQLFSSPSQLHYPVNISEKLLSPENLMAMKHGKEKMNICDVSTETENNANSLQLFSSESNKITVENSMLFSDEKMDTKLFVDISNDISNSEIVINRSKHISNTTNEIFIDEVTLPQSFENETQKSKNNCTVQYKTFSPSRRGTPVEHVIHVKKNIRNSKTSVAKNENRKFDNITSIRQTYDEQIISILGSHNLDENCEINKESDGNNRINKEYDDVMSKVLNITIGQNNNFQNDYISNTEISETLFSEDQQLNEVKTGPTKSKTSKHIIELGNDSKTRKSWQDIQNELLYGENLARAVDHTLNGMFEKLCLEEQESIEEQVKEISYKVESLHKFNTEDIRKLDIENLFTRNMSKLEKIAQGFNGKVNVGQMMAPDDEVDDNDYAALDWRRLLR